MSLFCAQGHMLQSVERTLVVIEVCRCGRDNNAELRDASTESCEAFSQRRILACGQRSLRRCQVGGRKGAGSKPVDQVLRVRPKRAQLCIEIEHRELQWQS